MFDYEFICHRLDSKTREAFEYIDEALQMLPAADRSYREAHKHYTAFCSTLDVESLKKCAAVLARVTGYCIAI